eukprot:TRINITY_DN21001_c0_g1_i1.p1 TRINITY_DN21001_c0_g1~~TRINITY_DN21001_c0_g1_i1.p1  ORF type:complete len:337 (+),score=55.61 TRINITY_DN21001_c0_g1_i1:39-1013(+)
MADEPEADFGVDIIQDRESVPLCWEEVHPGGDEVPIAILRPDIYSLKLTNNGNERIVARVCIDGNALRCLYYLAPRSTHLVRGRRVSENEVLPLHFQMVGRRVNVLRGLEISGILDNLGSVEVEFYKAIETNENRAGWKTPKTQSVLQAWSNDSASTVALHSATTYGVPIQNSVKHGVTMTPHKKWKIVAQEPLAVATVYLMDVGTSIALGLSPVAADVQDAVLENPHQTLVEAQQEARRWKEKFEKLAVWVDAHISQFNNNNGGGGGGGFNIDNKERSKHGSSASSYRAPSPSRPVHRPMKFSLSPSPVPRPVKAGRNNNFSF